jgi:hypothetical protein
MIQNTWEVLYINIELFFVQLNAWLIEEKFYFSLWNRVWDLKRFLIVIFEFQITKFIKFGQMDCIWRMWRGCVFSFSFTFNFDKNQ